jgi:hypothetical protein
MSKLISCGAILNFIVVVCEIVVIATTKDRFPEDYFFVTGLFLFFTVFSVYVFYNPEKMNWVDEFSFKSDDHYGHANMKLSQIFALLGCAFSSFIIYGHFYFNILG